MQNQILRSKYESLLREFNAQKLKHESFSLGSEKEEQKLSSQFENAKPMKQGDLKEKLAQVTNQNNQVKQNNVKLKEKLAELQKQIDDINESKVIDLKKQSVKS